MGHTPMLSSKVSARPTTSMNSGEHQKLCSLKLVSKAPACAASIASFSRSALVRRSCRASASASSWRLRVSMSSTMQDSLSGRPCSVSCMSPEMLIQRLSPEGSRALASREPKVKVSDHSAMVLMQ